MRYSTISPGLSDIGAQAPSNEHIERLGTVLLTYNFYETDLGRAHVVQQIMILNPFVPQVTSKGCQISVHRYMSSLERTKN